MILIQLGLYRELPYSDPNGESIHRTLKLDPAGKARVVAYLRDAPVFAASGILGTDYFTGGELGPFYTHTDGRWEWYSDLAHYVEHHDTWLPDDFVAVASQSDPPQLTDEELIALADSLFPNEE
ncbi:hypothetical protein [Microlunatus speluncae]|uniref:hypothetical protein n=1 Tax=Microlunatus speluncae TaxID=2594267 RepID=UPI0012667F8C|nr:hypothetical protein [Microlunatus speluncae]